MSKKISFGFDSARFRSTLRKILYSNFGENRMGWTVGVDVGGTFTDFYAANDQAGVFHVYKTSSTPSNPADAILNGLDAMCAKFDIPKMKSNECPTEQQLVPTR